MDIFFYDIFLYVPQNKERLETTLELKKIFFLKSAY